MGEVAVMHSEPLQFDCNDMKHITEKDVYNLLSNEEHILGEESISPADVNITEEDAVLGPPVVMRFLIAAIVTMRQKIISTLTRSIDTIFPAIKLNRFSKIVLTVAFVWASTSVGRVSSLMMMYLSSSIIAVAVEFAELEDVKISSTATNVVSNILCCCYSTQLKNSHPCVEGAMHHDCPICFEYLFESVNDVTVLLCGHTIHKSCLKEMREHFQYACPLCLKSVCDMSKVWEKFDLEIAATPMPEPYQNKMVWILCNDCGKSSHVQFHLVAQKCLNCKSYNTRETRG
ncbi:putative E3 ubiquitin-protein ligase RZFP34 [Glycine max]|nr:putative E3 ubiquitin-protein ligase RZFP34 [Glycine max]